MTQVIVAIALLCGTGVGSSNCKKQFIECVRNKKEGQSHILDGELLWECVVELKGKK